MNLKIERLTDVMTQTPSIRIIGYCNLSHKQIENLFLRGRTSDLLLAGGEFIIVIKYAADTIIVTSHNGIIPYYFCFNSRQSLIHGETIKDVSVKSRLPWKWNVAAFADYIALDHVLNSETMHPNIRRTPRNSTVSVVDGRFSVTDGPPKEGKSSGDPFEESVRELQREVLACWENNTILCLTGGFDSRLLLAVLLAEGIQPPLLVTGQEGSFDLRVACEIATHFNLPIYRTEVGLTDFLEYAGEIVEKTDGLLPMAHWPGVLLAKRSQNQKLILGFNGEFARSYYHDRGLASLLNQSSATRLTWNRYWLHRFYQPFSSNDLNCICPDLAEQFGAEANEGRIARLEVSTGCRGMKFDQVFLNQYSRNKTGKDLAAISFFAQWRAPFFSKVWMELVQRLPRVLKLGSWYHRKAIFRLIPGLLNFPEERRPLMATSRWPGWGYWLTSTSRMTVNHFFDQSIYEDRNLLDFAASCLTSLSDLIDIRLLNALRYRKSDRRLFFQLASLALWKANVTSR